MKNLLIISTTVLCLFVVGCVTKGSRFDPNATIKGKNTVCTHSCSSKNCCQVKAGDELGKKIDAASNRIKIAVREGKMTPEEGKEMMKALKKRDKRNK